MGEPLSPKTVHKTQASSVPTAPFHRTHTLEDKGDRGTEAKGLLCTDKYLLSTYCVCQPGEQNRTKQTQVPALAGLICSWGDRQYI